MKNIANMVEEIRNNPEAKELLDKNAKPTTKEETIKVYADIAKQLGIDLTEEELKEYLRAMEKQQAEKTAARAEAVEKVADDELAGVAGGVDVYECEGQFWKKHEYCQYSFLNEENCTITDGCDKFLMDYHEYYCAGTRMHEHHQ